MKVSRKIINQKYFKYKDTLDDIIIKFDNKNFETIKKERNTLKIFDLGKNKIVVKSFKVPNILNKIIYTFFKKTKAERSYNYAKKLLKLKINTAYPIGFYVTKNNQLIHRTFYICEYIDFDYTFDDFILKKFQFEEVTRLFSEFSYNLHQKNINFIDNTPGNTLIVTTENSFDFFLVDLNRMKFEKMTFKKRMKNLSKLTTDLKIINAVSEKYSKKINIDSDIVFKKIKFYMEKFQNNLNRKKKIKKKLGIG